VVRDAGIAPRLRRLILYPTGQAESILVDDLAAIMLFGSQA
jgi:hypothetical protein